VALLVAPGESLFLLFSNDLNNSSLTPVIINEVAWMGTQTSSSDEWIELKNVSGQDVNLNGGNF